MWGVYLVILLLTPVLLGDAGWIVVGMATVVPATCALIFGKKIRNQKRRRFRRLSGGDERTYLHLCMKDGINPEMED